MAISPAFTISQSPLSPSTVIATDTSIGVDTDIVVRHITFQTAYGTYLVVDGTLTDYEVWNYANASESWLLLDADTSASVTVEWLNAAGTVLYTLTQVYAFTEYNKQFFYYLIQLQALTPAILKDANYFSNMAIYWMNIVGAIQAIEIGADVMASQSCLDRATLMKNNEAKFF